MLRHRQGDRRSLLPPRSQVQIRFRASGKVYIYIYSLHNIYIYVYMYFCRFYIYIYFFYGGYIGFWVEGGIIRDTEEHMEKNSGY